MGRNSERYGDGEEEKKKKGREKKRRAEAKEEEKRRCCGARGTRIHQEETDFCRRKLCVVVFGLNLCIFGVNVFILINGYFDEYFRRSRLDLGIFELLLGISLTYKCCMNF